MPASPEADSWGDHRRVILNAISTLNGEMGSLSKELARANLTTEGALARVVTRLDDVGTWRSEMERRLREDFDRRLRDVEFARNGFVSVDVVTELERRVRAVETAPRGDNSAVVAALADVERRLRTVETSRGDFVTVADKNELDKRLRVVENTRSQALMLTAGLSILVAAIFAALSRLLVK